MPERINYYEYPRYYHSSRLIIMQICAGLGNVGSFSFETVHLSPYCNLGNCYVYFQ